MATNLRHVFLSDSVQKTMNDKIKKVLHGHDSKLPYKVELDIYDKAPVYKKIVSIKLSQEESLDKDFLAHLKKDIHYELSKYLMAYGWELMPHTPIVHYRSDVHNPAFKWVDVIYEMIPLVEINNPTKDDHKKHPSAE